VTRSIGAKLGKETFLQDLSGSTFPRRLTATVRLLRGSPFAPHFISAERVILEAVQGETQMDRGHLLQIIQPMLAGFKLEIAKMRSEGATQAEIDRMLDEFEEVYAADDEAEGKLVMAVLRQAARLPN
jgi:hypothetical protein